VETIGSKWSYALTWCTPNNDDDDMYAVSIVYAVVLRRDVCNVRSVSYILVGFLLLLLQRSASCSVLDWSRHLNWSVLCDILVASSPNGA